RTMSIVQNEDVDSHVNEFLKSFFNSCSYVIVNNSLISTFREVKNNLADLVDTRLFISLIQLYKDGDLDFEDNIPREIKQDFNIAWKILEYYNDNNFIISDNLLDNIKIPITIFSSNDANKELSLLPFNYPFFVNILGDMQLNINEKNGNMIDTGSYGIAGDIPYDEITHWHSTKPLKEPKNVKKRKPSQQKDYQKYVRFLDRYAQSLYGTQGFYKLKIIVDKKANKNSKYKKSNSAEKLIKQIEQDKLEKSLKDAEDSLDRIFEEIFKDSTLLSIES
ncbi:11276_t:CDS:1, partial [Scutellospora calospora]